MYRRAGKIIARELQIASKGQVTEHLRRKKAICTWLVFNQIERDGTGLADGRLRGRRRYPRSSSSRVLCVPKHHLAFFAPS